MQKSGRLLHALQLCMLHSTDLCPALSVLLAVHAYIIQAAPQLAHACAQKPLVHLNLLLTHTPHLTPRLPLQVRPHLCQPRQLVFTLSQLHLYQAVMQDSSTDMNWGRAAEDSRRDSARSLMRLLDSRRILCCLGGTPAGLLRQPKR